MTWQSAGARVVVSVAKAEGEAWGAVGNGARYGGDVVGVTNTELRNDIKALHQDIRENNSLLVGFDERLRATEVDMSAVKTEQVNLKETQDDLKGSHSAWNRGLLILNVVTGAVASALGMSTRS